MTVDLKILKPEIRTKLLNWMGRRINEVLPKDNSERCRAIADQLLQAYELGGEAEHSKLTALVADALARSLTLTSGIGLLTPARRIEECALLVTEMLEAIQREKVVAVVQVLTEP